MNDFRNNTQNIYVTRALGLIAMHGMDEIRRCTVCGKEAHKRNLTKKTGKCNKH